MSSSAPARGNPSLGDIVRSVLVIGLILLAVYGVGRFFTRDGGDPVKPIDYATVVAQARPAADFELLAPARLPDGWRATSARFEPDSWHLGVLTADDEYLGLEQVKVSVDRAVDLFADESRAAGEAQVAGRTWQVRTGPRDRTTYVSREDGLTTLVNGTTTRAELETYVASLSED